jgi:hypothetical protein
MTRTAAVGLEVDFDDLARGLSLGVAVVARHNHRIVQQTKSLEMRLARIGDLFE